MRDGRNAWEGLDTRFPLQGGQRTGEKKALGGSRSAAGSECQLLVYFPLLTTVCLGSLSLHIIKERALRCDIKVGVQMCGHLVSLESWGWPGGTFASRSTLNRVRKPQPVREGAQGRGEQDGQKGQEFYFLLEHRTNRPPSSHSIRGSSQQRQKLLKCVGS